MSALFLLGLLLNAILSFLVGTALVLTALKLLRIRAGGFALYLLTLPFAKIVYDLVRWLPGSGDPVAAFDPLRCAGNCELSISAGLNAFGPYLAGGLRVLARGGGLRPISAGSLAATRLNAWLSPGTIALLVAGILSLSLAFAGGRLFALARFEARRRRQRQATGLRLACPTVGRRRVDIYVATVERGVPFAGGLLRPYICLPGDAYQSLSAVEREAVIQHELAHVRRFDVVPALLIALLGDLFWFVPGYRRLQRRIEDVRELVADRQAVRSGAEPLALASALLCVREARLTPAHAALPSALSRRRSILAERIRWLSSPAVRVDGDEAGGFGIRLLLALVITAVVLMSSFAEQGNPLATDAFSHFLSQQVIHMLGIPGRPF